MRSHWVQDCPRIRELARQESVTTRQLLMAGFQILIGSYSGQEDVVIGVAVAGRTMHEDLEGLIGCFINMLAVRTDLSGDPTFRELVGPRPRYLGLGPGPSGPAVREAG